MSEQEEVEEYDSSSDSKSEWSFTTFEEVALCPHNHETSNPKKPPIEVDSRIIKLEENVETGNVRPYPDSS